MWQKRGGGSRVSGAPLKLTQAKNAGRSALELTRNPLSLMETRFNPGGGGGGAAMLFLTGMCEYKIKGNGYFLRLK